MSIDSREANCEQLAFRYSLLVIDKLYHPYIWKVTQMSTPITDSKTWDSLWSANFAKYIEGAPRTGVFVHRITPKAKTYLELGAGSARDSFYLNIIGKHAVASDFSEIAIDAWRKSFGPVLPAKLVDAFHIDATDGAFDVTFHNGLYVLFDDDKIKALVAEQRRVTRSTMIIIVHNKRNSRLVSSFAQLGDDNPIFRIRLFDPLEMVSLVQNSGIPYRKITVHKFGGPADRFYHWFGARVHDTKRSSIAGALANILYPLQPWARVERAAIVVHCAG